ncbi:Type I Polyketide synthases (Type I PKS) [Penicillium longicatenatum]|uniref:Type I Polyketide synthases (Type I PKS) n=1 Tax=Penicillium longicatenatum TaxID=1561947 RepID=UPI00254997C8|nr:Type I Polyketide synthases (Type I PKS) [Penicillium longicatenatum]KAJ5639455.1 Type I Polyketide synthases (Type I PKS) [Penicillium longicatenatum]
MVEHRDLAKDQLSGPAVFLFGPLALSFNSDSFAQLREIIVENEEHKWALDTITSLPQYWKTIVAAIPGLEAGTELEKLEDLKEAFSTGQSLKAQFPLPNALLIPLVVSLHLTQYASFIKLSNADLDNDVDLFALSKDDQETLGLCTGLLSSLAVSSAGNKADFLKFAAVAVRLGLLIGMVVDARDAATDLGASKSLTMAWNSAEKAEETKRILKGFTHTYVSVNYDDDRATITTLASHVSEMQLQLRACGIITAEVGLCGRFHADCHRDQLPAILKFCDSHSDFRFPDASKLIIPTRSNADGALITEGPLHHHALHSILVEPPKWFDTFTVVCESTLNNKDVKILSFGPERSVPPSILRGLGQRVVNVADLEKSQQAQRSFAPSDIAVVGMSCKVAGADNLEEFWDLLCTGKSQHKEVPKERFGFETAFRDVDSKRKWFGNFINGHDEFDHKFFKRSPRESATMDPQQRHFLQIAYQSVEQSGYFHNPSADKHIGCYVGVCACDYESNIACHAPNAFTATGNLQGFIAGKVSHFFGWTGPGLTIDTACSSSAVAVHSACKAILSGECTAALAGGTHVMTNPLWFQNLSGASFLSTTGQCKPFDAKADGYCRGEGIASVFLKKLSAAIDDGDQILGVIAASAVQQNENCTPIFVPNVPSLSDLFRTVTKQAGLQPGDISVVEAHGTGTAVGDPAEYGSIRSVLGGSVRTKPLTLSSVKGLIGHTECTSGIVSMIKVLLMIQKGMIPPQASFSAINSAIGATPADRINIPTSVQTWNADFRAALINNYGASGSNASLVITQPPAVRARPAIEAGQAGITYPFRFCGFDDSSLRRYSVAFRKFISNQDASVKDLSLSNIAFNLNRQSNRQLERTLIFTAQSLDDLQEKLISYENGSPSLVSLPSPKALPIVLCFGGQVSTFVGLDRSVYERVAVFRKHLDTVNAVARSLGAGSIYPNIFSRSPIADTVQLQVILFAMQYACARSWIDSGVEPVAVVGHSFGELTALCISQILSLEDTIKMIIARATLIRDAWGSDKGAMMAVEGDLSEVQKLVSESNEACDGVEPANIACYNGPRSFTLAGPTAAIDAVAQRLSLPAFATMKHKRLNVSNAFHSVLLDPLLERLEQSAQQLTFRKPIIPMERATEVHTEEKLDAKFVPEHIRSSVFFNHALQRLAKKYPECVFLEAGSNSTITNMASRALGNPSSSHFQGINITSDNAWNNLASATVSLWKAGVRTQFWAHQSTQTREHAPLLLPPYQFESARHWTELKAPLKMIETAAPQQVDVEASKLPETLLSFVGYQDSGKRLAKFRVNTMIPKYEKLIEGHVIAQTAPICPATIQLELAIEAVRIIRPDLAGSTLEPQIQAVENLSPVCINPARAVWIEVTAQDSHSPSWDFNVFSDDLQRGGVSKTVHTTGKIAFRSVEDSAFKLEFARYERHFSHQRCVDMLQSGDVDEILRSRNIYKMFSGVVDYAEEYRGVQKLVSKGSQSAGYVVKEYNPESWLDGHLADSFCQVGGVYVNCMANQVPTDMFIANGIEQWIRSPMIRQNDPRPKAYHVLATHHNPSNQSYLTDVFVFNSENGSLVEVILGISYVRVSKASMSKLLTRLTVRDGEPAPASIKAPVERPTLDLFAVQQTAKVAPPLNTVSQEPKPSKPAKVEEQTPKVDVVPRVKAILADLSGLELHEIKNDSELAELGIDSLMGMEMAHEIEAEFNIELPESELMKIVDMPSLIKCVETFVCGAPSSDASEQELDESDERSSNDTTPSTPVDSGDLDKSLDDFKVAAGLNLPFATVMEAFNETKSLTDDRIAEHGQTNYVESVLPAQTEMCVALTLEAFEQLGVGFRTAKPGQKFARIPHPKEHTRLVSYLYKMLEDAAGLINIDGEVITRTAAPAPTKSSKELLADLLRRFPDQSTADKLTFYTGSHLAEVLRGETDGIKLIFGTSEGRELVSGLYAEWPINRLMYKQMEDFLGRLASKLDVNDGPIKILEMGAGTGGTTRWLLPLLASLQLPVEYTFTDLAPSFVAAARKKFGKQYPFMKFRTHDIEKAPADDLIGTQHIIVASNAVHATHSLSESAKNIRKALRPDGFLMMIEMTGTLYWVDIIFGLFEGWWYFDDGRTHAVTHESRWEKDLQAVGYGHVDWTDGDRPENKLERLIGPSADLVARQAVVDRYVRDMTSGFDDIVDNSSFSVPGGQASNPSGRCVVVTGATGSLGCHLVAKFASLPDVTQVVCLNRRSRQDPESRQTQSLRKKGIVLPAEAASKLCVFETDMFKPQLGLSSDEYASLVRKVTHIVHNAWLMNAKWPIKNFEPQLRIMRNLLDFAKHISTIRSPGTKVTFQFISSIATVGHWPIWTGRPAVPEERMTIDSVLPTGYGDAKYICELMIDETLHRHPDQFRAMAVRLGQVAGSSTSGYWNPTEHLPFVIKSSQTLKALPDFDGLLSWTPVDGVASTLVDLVSLPETDTPYPIYHIDNPIRQAWKEMIPVLADTLSIPLSGVIPFDDWVQRVKDHPRQVEGPEGENPAILLIDFLDANFLRMSCGGLLLETKKAREHSHTLASLGPVSNEVTKLFVESWKEMGFLA